MARIPADDPQLRPVHALTASGLATPSSDLAIRRHVPAAGLKAAAAAGLTQLLSPERCSADLHKFPTSTRSVFDAKRPATAEGGGGHGTCCGESAVGTEPVHPCVNTALHNSAVSRAESAVWSSPLWSSRHALLPAVACGGGRPPHVHRHQSECPRPAPRRVAARAPAWLTALPPRPRGQELDT